MIAKIKKVNSDLEIVSMPIEDGLKIKNKYGEITIYDKKIIASIVDDNFDKKYREILYAVMNLSDNDESGEDAYLVLEKIEELRNLLINKYQKFLRKDTLNRYLKKISLIEGKIVIPKKGRGR